MTSDDCCYLKPGFSLWEFSLSLSLSLSLSHTHTFSYSPSLLPSFPFSFSHLLILFPPPSFPLCHSLPLIHSFPPLHQSQLEKKGYQCPFPSVARLRDNMQTLQHNASYRECVTETGLDLSLCFVSCRLEKTEKSLPNKTGAGRHQPFSRMRLLR
jgi:hypothetical protein